jgi:subtilisin family serine protease
MRPRAAAGIALLAGAAVVLAGAARALTPTDPQGGHPSYAQLGLPAAWEITIGSPEVVVAVVDTGVDPGHPDLAGAVQPGHDFVDDDGDAGDPPGFGHGTAVAGVAAARAGNGLGGVGACFRCSVLPLRVIGPDGFALNTNTAAAIDYAVDHGAAVVNASLYGPRSPKVLRDSIVRARSAGVLVVAAAGNEANSAEQYPAAFPEAIAVASATAGGPLASFSSRGDWVDFAAPECAPITALGGGFGVGCATSVSTPLVAGVVALLRAQAPFATAAELEAALASTARPVAGTRHGLVDAAAALARLGRPPPRLSPVILGEPVVGEELEAFSGVWSGAGLGVAYHWERCRESCDAIPGRPRHAMRRPPPTRGPGSASCSPPRRPASRHPRRPRSSEPVPDFSRALRSGVDRVPAGGSSPVAARGRAAASGTRSSGCAAGETAPPPGGERAIACAPGTSASGCGSR